MPSRVHCLYLGSCAEMRVIDPGIDVSRQLPEREPHEVSRGRARRVGLINLARNLRVSHPEGGVRLHDDEVIQERFDAKRAIQLRIAGRDYRVADQDIEISKPYDGAPADPGSLAAVPNEFLAKCTIVQ